MNPQKNAIAGSMESGDALVRVRPSDFLQIDIKSPVKAQYGAEIEKVCRETLQNMKVDAADIEIVDRGALDCTIKARVETAIKRALEEEKK